MELRKLFIEGMLAALLLSGCTTSIVSSHEQMFFAKDGVAYLYDLEDGKVVQTKSYDFSEPVYGVQYNPETEEIFFLTSDSWHADSNGHGEENCTEHRSCYAKIYKGTWDTDPALLLDITGRIYEWNLAEDGLYTVQYTPETGRQFTHLDSAGAVVFTVPYQFEEPRTFGDLVTFKDHSYQVNGTQAELYLSSLDNEDGSLELEKMYDEATFVDTTFTNISPDETTLQFYVMGSAEKGYNFMAFVYDLQQKLFKEIDTSDFDRSGATIWSGDSRKFSIGLNSGLSYYDLDDEQFHTIAETTYTPLAWAPLNDKMVLLSDEGTMFVYDFTTGTLNALPEEFQAFELIDIDGLEVFAAGYEGSN